MQAELSHITFYHCIWHVQVVRARRCSAHKFADMINVNHKFCEECGKRMMRGYKLISDKRIRWCEKCKPDNAVSGRPDRE